MLIRPVFARYAVGESSTLLKINGGPRDMTSSMVELAMHRDTLLVMLAKYKKNSLYSSMMTCEGHHNLEVNARQVDASHFLAFTPEAISMSSLKALLLISHSAKSTMAVLNAKSPCGRNLQMLSQKLFCINRNR